MELQEYLGRKKVLDEKIAELERERIQLKHQYISELPFKVNDKIEVRGRTYWIVGICLYYNNNFELTVNYPKKDGTRSKSRRSLWNLTLGDIKVIGHED